MYRSLIILTSLLSPVLAQDDLYESLKQTQHEPSYFGMFMGLIVVIGLVYLTGILYKKLTKIKLDSTADDKYAINILSSASLGQNKNLFVIKIENKLSLIGVTNEQIVHIKELGEDYEN